MKRTGLVIDERYLLHDTGPDHPESSERLKVIYAGIEAAGLMPKLVLIPGRRVEEKWVRMVHAEGHIRRFEEACACGYEEYGHPDNRMCGETFETALLAVGGVLDAAKMVMEGKLDNAFCAVRPPGHHAEANEAMGFCYFNNIAIAARYLQTDWGIARVGIVDFDVHHGNGTQHIFASDPTVFYYSIHEHPTFAYPGTGREFERGSSLGHGYTLNTPMLPGKGDQEYREALERDLVPAFNDFKPEVILVSAGFDAHEDDDMSYMKVSTQGFTWIMHLLMELADKHAQGRIISILEGGYCLERLPELVINHLKVLLQMPDNH